MRPSIYHLAGDWQALNGQQQQGSFRALAAVAYVSSYRVNYDAAGNLTADGTQVYTYNARSRLAGVRAGITTRAYLYNGDWVLAQETTAGTATVYPQARREDAL